MAKSDFCFTYYDGDAARDMAHMSRLERGGYTDIIISQRKFGWLTLEQIKKILGKDFDEVWDSISLVMKFENEKYYIEWLQNSESRAGKHSGKQSENGKKGGRPGKNKTEIILTESQTEANQNPNESHKKPLGDGDGDIGSKGEERGAGEEEPSGGDFLPIPIVVEMKTIWLEKKPDYPVVRNATDDEQALFAIGEFIGEQLKLPWLPETHEQRAQLIAQWRALADWIVGDGFYRRLSLSSVSATKSMQTIWQRLKDPQNGNNDFIAGGGGSGKQRAGTSTARVASLKSW